MKSVYFENNQKIVEIIPEKIVCVGLNFLDHIKEMNSKIPENDMVLFMKPNSSLSNDVFLPKDRCRYEVEISFLIKNQKLFKVGVGLDLTLVDIQKKLKKNGHPWERSKSFLNSAVFSKFVDFDENYDNISVKLFLNNKLMQTAKIKNMIHKPNEILKEINEKFSLENGDIIMCGTPSGVSDIKKGDLIKVILINKNNEILEKEWEVL